MKLFHSPYYAVMAVELDDENKPDTIICIGFYPSENHAKLAVWKYNTELIKAHKLHEYQMRRWYFVRDSQPIAKISYAVINLLEFQYEGSWPLSGLDSWLEDTAKLRMVP